jgi:hypothetical protein
VTPDPARKLGALLKRIRSAAGEPIDPWEQCRPAAATGQPTGAGDELVWHVVFSFMAWEAGTACAVAACQRLHQAVVDYNELRVCLPDEVAALLGANYPHMRERSLRLRAVLNDIYRREHRVTLAHLPAMGRREARLYLESLEGMPLFVSGRLALLSLDTHAFPLDQRLRRALLDEQALPADVAGTDISEAVGWLERHFRAGEAAPAYRLLEAWMNQQGSPCPTPPTGKPPEDLQP